MVWDYPEGNPIFGNWNITWAMSWIIKVIEHAALLSTPVMCHQGDAAALPFENGIFSAVVTDPPYYDSVPYADLSDFFYVWLRRALAKAFPEVLRTPLTPKTRAIASKRRRDYSGRRLTSSR